METMKNRPSPQRKGKKSEFTAVDAVVLLLVLVTVLGAVLGWVYQALDDGSDLDEGAAYAVTFRISETHRDVADGLSVGDAVYLIEDGSFLGYLRDDLAVQDETDAAYPDRVTGTGSMVCVGNINGRSLELGDGGRCLTPGDTLLVRTEREFLTIDILEIVSAGK